MPSAIEPSSVVRAADHQVSCELHDEVVILNVASGMYYALDPVGARIWALISQARSIEEIRQILLREYTDVTPERCEREVLALLAEMVDAGLVELVAPAGA